MEKLIITVAGDSRTSYPHNNLCPTQEDIAACTQQYVDAVKAGAAISHIHGRRTLEESIQADGKMVSRIHHADWKKLHHMITDKVDTDHAVRRGVGAHRGEDRADEARPRHDGGRLQRPRRIFPAGADACRRSG